jgi:hypothetical protein
MNLVDKSAPLVMGHKYHAAHQIKRAAPICFPERRPVRPAATGLSERCGCSVGGAPHGREHIGQFLAISHHDSAHDGDRLGDGVGRVQQSFQSLANRAH